jgi:hypothetical protein
MPDSGVKTRVIKGISGTVKTRLAILSCLLLAGCGEGMKSSSMLEEIMSHRKMAQDQGPPTETVMEPQPALSMPTDLSLPPPAAKASDDTGARERVKTDILSKPTTVDPEGKVAALTDPYEAYGISRYNEDGTPKSKEQLKKELREAYLKLKRKENPNYGTYRNLGNIFE